MTIITPSRSLAALGLQFTPFRTAPSSRCTVHIALRGKDVAQPAFIHAKRYATQINRPKQADKDGVSSRAQYTKVARRSKSQLKSSANTKTQLSPARQPSASKTLDIQDAINPPDSTRPAPVDVPARKPDQYFLSHALQIGRAYWAFYKTGVKNVWSNNKLRKPLNAKLQAYKDAQIAAYKRVESRPPTAQELDDVLSRQIAQYPLSRAEWQFVTRSARDVKKVPLFAGLLLVFGEWLPLVVVFCTPLVPFPCRIPTQIRKEEVKLAKRRSLSFRGVIGAGVPAPSVSQKGVEDTHEAVRAAIRELDTVQLRHACRSLNLFFGLFDGTSVWPPTFLLRLRLQRQWMYIRQDDRLLKRDGGVSKLKDEEIKIAAQERGIDTLNRDDGDVLASLDAWADKVESQGLALLLSRPSVWTPAAKR